MRRHLWLLATLLAACSSPTIPGRDAGLVYEFRLTTQPPLVLRWPAGTRVRVYVNHGPVAVDNARLDTAFVLGAQAWNDLADFAEYHLERAADLDHADVVLSLSDEVLPVETSNCQPALTQAVTTFCLDETNPAVLRLRTFPRSDAAASQVKMLVLVLAIEAATPETLDRLVAHELGHVLGIGRHSPDARDLMYRTDPQVAQPSSRDAATMQVLYHVHSDIVP